VTRVKIQSVLLVDEMLLLCNEPWGLWLDFVWLYCVCICDL